MNPSEIVRWADCPLVEIRPGVQSGAPVLKGTRLPVAAIVDNFAFGLDAAEIAVQFEVSVEMVEAVLRYSRCEGAS